MEKILFIDACARPDSRTRELAERLLTLLPGAVTRVPLYQGDLAPLDRTALENRESLVRSGHLSHPSLASAREFAQADTLVIAAPFWDLSFPSVLKIYLEAVTVSGITFRYTPQGIPQGLCRARRLYYVATAGGYPGPEHLGFQYVKAMAQSFFGIPQVRSILAQGLDVAGNDPRAILEEVKGYLPALLDQSRRIPCPESYDRSAGAAAFAGAGDHCQSKYYVHNDFYSMESAGTLHILSRFRTYQQTTEYTCGAACALMVLHWFGKEKFHELALGQLVESHPTRGTTLENLADLFDLLGWQVEAHGATRPRFETVEEAEKAIVDYIDRGIPLLVDWVDWAGHWQVLIGIDTCGADSPYDDVLIFADPYDVTDHAQEGYYTFPLGRFFSMWREGPCAEKAQPYLQPHLAVWPK